LNDRTLRAERALSLQRLHPVSLIPMKVLQRSDDRMARLHPEIGYMNQVDVGEIGHSAETQSPNRGLSDAELSNRR
jgi:hypothetical protein